MTLPGLGGLLLLEKHLAPVHRCAACTWQLALVRRLVLQPSKPAGRCQPRTRE